MQTSEETRIDKLIKMASEKSGTEYKLAQAMGYSQQHFTKWKNGTRPCPIEAQAIMAEIAGLEAMEVVAAALLERNKGKRQYKALEKAVGKVYATIRGAAVAKYGAGLSLVFSLGWIESVVQKTQCVLQLSKKTQFQMSRKALFFCGHANQRP